MGWRDLNPAPHLVLLALLTAELSLQAKWYKRKYVRGKDSQHYLATFTIILELLLGSS